MALEDIFKNIVDEDALRERLVVPLLKQVVDQVVPAFQNALAFEIDRLVGEAGAVIGGLPKAIQDTADHLILEDLSPALELLRTINGGGELEIRIRLNKKEK